MSRLTLVAVVFACSAMAGWVGWRKETDAIYYRPRFEPRQPSGMTWREYERLRHRRRRLRRTLVTAVYALTGASGAAVGLLFVINQVAGLDTF